MFNEQALSYCIEKGWIKENVNGTDIVSKSEFADIIKNLLLYSSYADYDFYDGLEGITSDETPLTRELLATVLCKAFHLPNSDLDNIKDASYISNWAKGSVGFMLKQGYMSTQDGLFNPQAQVNYFEAAQVIFNSHPVNVAWNKLTGEGDFVMWHNMNQHAVILDPKPYKTPNNGILYKQRGTIRGLMFVIDFEDAKAEDNTGGNGNFALNGTDNLKTAEDYYHFLYHGSANMFRTASYGLVDFELDLLKDPDTATGVFRMGKPLSEYAFKRGGDVDKYLKDEVMIKRVQEVLSNSKEFNKTYDVLYVVAVENAKGISYGPMNTDGKLANAITGRTDFRSLVRIGLDSYTSWKYKGVNHETTHALNIVDLYINDFSGPSTGQADPISGKTDYYMYCGGYDYMGNILAQAPDLFAWNKWRLGWIDDSQVDIINFDGTTTHILTPIEEGKGTKAVIIPGNINGVAFIIEYRQKLGLDAETLPHPGILMYKIDCNVESLAGPLTTINLHPDLDGKKSINDALMSSTLGSSTGIWKYSDEAAGITVSIEDPKDETLHSCKIKVEYTNKFNSVSPTLYDAKFIDKSTIEVKTTHDLRGITKEKIILTINDIPVDGVKINQISSRSMRVTFDENSLNDPSETEMNVKIKLESFSFYGESNTCNVEPLALSETFA